MNIYLDIETVPAQDPAVRAELAAEITAPGNYKKAESIAEWERDHKPALVDEAWRKTSFDGARGQIVCISVAADDSEPATYFYDDWANKEQDIIAEAFSYIDLTFDPSSQRKPVFIGHNIVGFDLRFLFQRAVINGIKPPSIIPFHAKPWDAQVYDTMAAWAGVGNRVSMDKLCKALKIAGKGSEIGEEIDGSKVWDFVQAGRIADVAKYCAGDVERVRAIHKAMTFA